MSDSTNTSSAEPRLSVDVDRAHDPVTVSLEGELDLATVGVAEEALREAAEANPLVLDLRKLSFLDSSGLRLILMTAESSAERGSRLVVVRGPAQVDKVFELTGVGERLEVVDDPALIEQS